MSVKCYNKKHLEKFRHEGTEQTGYVENIIVGGLLYKTYMSLNSSCATVSLSELTPGLTPLETALPHL